MAYVRDVAFLLPLPRPLLQLLPLLLLCAYGALVLRRGQCRKKLVSRIRPARLLLRLHLQKNGNCQATRHWPMP